MKHFKQLTLIILSLSLLLCGCGGTQANTKNDNTENNSTNNNQNNNTIIEKDEYTFSEYISDNETIWFLTDGYGKDAKIKNIFVLGTNNTLYYYDSDDVRCDLDWTLGEVEQMNDSDIISNVKQAYNHHITERLNRNMNYQGKEFDLSILVSDPKPIFTPYIDNIQPAQYKLGIISDSTGNKTEKEVLAFQDFAPLDIDRPNFNARIVNIELSYLAPYESDKGTTNCFQVYDSWYGGYMIREITCDNSENTGDLKGTYYFLTRTTINKIFNFDEVGTENIGIDNIDSLFDEISVEVEWKAAEDY